MHREKLLEDVYNTICRDRQDQYGAPEDNFQYIANFWNNYLSAKNHIALNLSAEDVAVMMSLLKVARMATGVKHYDNYIDAAGYLALAGEQAFKEYDYDSYTTADVSNAE
jgi:hypothetical protein